MGEARPAGAVQDHPDRRESEVGGRTVADSQGFPQAVARSLAAAGILILILSLPLAAILTVRSPNESIVTGQRWAPGSKAAIVNAWAGVRIREAPRLFGQTGNVRSVFLPVDRLSGRPRGFGFVEMSNEAEVAHRCLILPGRWGICRVRENRNGALYTHVYGRTVAQDIDPVEKKPLYHFYPGTTAYSIATVGCNFHCLISQVVMPDQFLLGEEASPREIVRCALLTGCRSIAYTYTEPTVFFEYAFEAAAIAHAAMAIAASPSPVDISIAATSDAVLPAPPRRPRGGRSESDYKPRPLAQCP